MKRTGPYLTLVGGLAVGGVLLALSTNAVQQDATISAAESAAAAADTTPTQEADVAGSAEPSTEATTPAATEPAATKPPVKAAEPAAPAGTYAGAVKGGGASVAIAVKGGKAIAYVCDGTKVEAWLQGSAADAKMSLAGKSGSAIKATYTDGRLTGTISTAGKKWTFRVKAVKAPSGLYRAASNVRNAKVIGGWIVYENKQVGLLNRSTGADTPAPPIDLATGSVIIDGTAVQATAVDASAAG